MFRGPTGNMFSGFWSGDWSYRNPRAPCLRALKEEVLGKKAGFEAGGILFLLFSWSKGMSFVQKDPQLGFLGLSGRLFDDDVFFSYRAPFFGEI